MACCFFFPPFNVFFCKSKRVQTHNSTAAQRWGRASQQEAAENTGAIEAPSTNHSGKNACHFPTSGPGSPGSQMCDLLCIGSAAGCQRLSGVRQQGCPPTHRHGNAVDTKQPWIRAIRARMCLSSLVFVCWVMISPGGAHVKLITYSFTVSQRADILPQ